MSAARATRKQLEARHGLIARLVRPGETEPHELWVRVMGEKTEVWKQVSGRGLESIFELIG